MSCFMFGVEPRGGGALLVEAVLLLSELSLYSRVHISKCTNQIDYRPLTPPHLMIPYNYLCVFSASDPPWIDSIYLLVCFDSN